MKNEFVIEICAGTKCYVLGGSQLINLEDSLPPEIRDRVKIEQVKCLSACANDDSSPPFVRINGVLLANATISRIIAYLRAG